jgi:hypothetical protein
VVTRATGVNQCGIREASIEAYTRFISNGVGTFGTFSLDVGCGKLAYMPEKRSKAHAYALYLQLGEKYWV